MHLLPPSQRIRLTLLKTFKNRRNATSYIPAPEGARVYDLINMIGTAGISSDEEFPTPPGHGHQYVIFDKPWRASSLVNLYRYLDLIHAATRNPNGNPIRKRVRQERMLAHPSPKAPKELPSDCYDSSFLKRCTVVKRFLLDAKSTMELDDLWNRVQELGPSYESLQTNVWSSQ